MYQLLQTGIPTSLDEVVAQYGPAIVSALATAVLFVLAFVVIYYVARAILVGATQRSLTERGFRTAIVGLAASIAGIVALFAAIAAAATVAGFGTVLSAFAILTGALALAIGFALQDLIGNFVAGVFIIRDEPFRVGDVISWNGNTGTVRDIQLRVTTLDTFDNETVTVPNGQLASAVLVNPVANDTLRVTYDFGISYDDDDIRGAQAAIVDVAKGIEGALTDPEPTAPVADLADSAVVLNGRPWIDPRESSAAGIRAEFVQAVKERFDADGISIPYPHTTVEGGISVAEIDTGAVDRSIAD
jgi:small-conductance mechanosensitive channel